MTLLFWLLVGHAVADYPLQGDFLARGKNHRAPLPGVPWLICLMSHAAIHAGAVALVTGSVEVGLIEFVLHMVIDFLKCDGWFDGHGYWEDARWGLQPERAFAIDQALHVACKVVYAVALGLAVG